MNLGELTIALDLDRGPFAQGLAQTRRDLEGIPPVAQREMVRVSQIFQQEGNRSGGVLAQGISQGLIRNSPLIVAAVSAALAAGAPLMTASAVALFGGVAAVAASQSLDVRNVWNELWQDVRSTVVAEAAVLIPTFMNMAEQVGRAFERVGPMIEGAFADAAPLIDEFTVGLVALVENAMPGLTRAVSAAGPVMEGFSSFLSSAGTGLTDFFDAISAHTPAAGESFGLLGSILGDLLPILGELLGQGAELASDVLPAVAAATSVALDVLQALGPLLPAIVTGFLAFKAAGVAAGFLATFAVQAQLATMAMTGSAAAGARVGGALAGMGRALPGIGLAVGVVATAMAIGKAQTDEWTRALLEGGKAAATARAEMTDSSWVDQGIFATGSFEWLQQIAGAMGEGEKAAGSAREEYDRMVASMTEVERAELRVAQATSYLNQMLDEHGAGSSQAEGAARALASAEKDLADEAGDAERAIHGVTTAMIAQAEQALAMANADYAYRSALEGIDEQVQAIADAQYEAAAAGRALGDAQREHGAKSAEAASAQRDLDSATRGVSSAQFELEGSLLAAAEAAGRLAADSLPATATELQKQQSAAAGSLAELERLRTEMGGNFPPALNQAIERLRQSGVAIGSTGTAASDTAARVRDLGFSVREVPGQKFVRIDAPTGTQIQQLRDLGWHVVNLPNGDIFVAANTADAEAALNYTARNRDSRVTQYVTTVGNILPGGKVVPQRAAGGPVWPGETFLVGEKGPELVRFAGHGTVIPADETRAIRAAAGAGQVGLPGATAGGRSAPTGGSSGPRTVINDNRVVNATAIDARQLARELDEHRRDTEFLAGIR